MNGKFSLYLLYAIIIMILIFLLVIYKRRKSIVDNDEDIQIICGNISVFSDKDSKITIIPYVKDKYGAGRALPEIYYLKPPYKKAVFGQTIREAMNLCESGSPCTNNELMVKLGFLDWKEFSRGKKNISIHFQKGRGIVFTTTIRKEDGSYVFNSTRYGRTIPANATNNELGEVYSKLVKWCKC